MTEIRKSGPSVIIHIKAIEVQRRPGGREKRFKRIFRFLSKKGYVRTGFPPTITYRKQLFMRDLIWVAETIEPRLFEVIPAVAIRFPKSFDHNEIWPEDLLEIIRTLKSGVKSGGKFRGVACPVLQEWLDFTPKDQRCRRKEGARLSVRLDAATARRLKEYAAKTRTTLTTAIHIAIDQLSSE